MNRRRAVLGRLASYHAAIGAVTSVTATLVLPQSVSSMSVLDTPAPSGRLFEYARPEANTLICLARAGGRHGLRIGPAIRHQAMLSTTPPSTRRAAPVVAEACSDTA